MSSAKRTPSGYSRPWTSALVWNGRLLSVRAIPSYSTSYYMATQETIGAEVDDLVGRAVTAIDELALAGRRLAVMGENCADTIIAHLGALAAGVSSVPVPRYLGVDEIVYILRDSGAGALLSGPATAETAQKAAAEAGVPDLR